jgi:hypothetical protein
MTAELIPDPNRLAERVTGSQDGLTLEQLLERAEEIVDRTVCQWHAGAVQEVTFMTGTWAHSGRARDDIVTTVLCFAAVANDMKVNAEQLGYPDVAAAAATLVRTLLAFDSEADGGDDAGLRAQGEAVTAALARLRRCLAEPRRVWADGRDLLATAEAAADLLAA